MNKPKSKYYLDVENNNLYSVSINTGTIRHRNTTIKPQIVDNEYFDSLNVEKIKKDKFSNLMNIYFKDVNDEWIFEEQKMIKLPNFESDDFSLILPRTYKDINFSVSYDWNKLPRHECGAYGNCIVVYHWGRVYYFTISYNGYPQGQLLDIKTKSHARWAKAKHCAPIFNFNSGKII